MIKVCKFGGSSVANASQFEKVKKIVESDKTRKFVVTSACGKIDKNDHKITDLLYLTFQHVKYGFDFNDIFIKIEEKYKNIINDLNIDINIDKEFDDIKNQIKNGMSEDFLVSRGEYLTAKILSKYLNFDFIDAKDFISFDYSMKIDLKTTKEKFDKIFVKNKNYVFPGFYGTMPNGDIKVMSRGGSDITGSIIANIIDADIYENWTDVSGIMVCDPRIVDNPKTISYISYDELREISYMGANVLHDEAIFPVKEKGIPINIRNTNDMDNKGTMIVKDCKKYDIDNPPFVITGITGKKDFCIVAIRKENISSEPGVIRKSLKVFEDFNVSIECVPASIDSFCIVVEKSRMEKYQYEIVQKIKDVLDCDEIKIINDVAMIGCVGRNLVNRIGTAGNIFKTIGDNNINIKFISQGSDEITIIMGIENKDYEKAINCIYDAFIKNNN